jgi:hypothetical protein
MLSDWFWYPSHVQLFDNHFAQKKTPKRMGMLGGFVCSLFDPQKQTNDYWNIIPGWNIIPKGNF